ASRHASAPPPRAALVEAVLDHQRPSDGDGDPGRSAGARAHRACDAHGRARPALRRPARALADAQQFRRNGELASEEDQGICSAFHALAGSRRATGAARRASARLRDSILESRGRSRLRMVQGPNRSAHAKERRPRLHRGRQAEQARPPGMVGAGAAESRVLSHRGLDREGRDVMTAWDRGGWRKLWTREPKDQEVWPWETRGLRDLLIRLADDDGFLVTRERGIFVRNLPVAQGDQKGPSRPPRAPREPSSTPGGRWAGTTPEERSA